jgi:tryptophanyl-tRNA synthetase
MCRRRGPGSRWVAAPALGWSSSDDSTVQEVETRYRNGGIGYGEVKALLAEVIEQHLAPLRHRYERLRAEPAALHERLAEGERHAAGRADRVLTRAMTAMGI